MSITRHGTNRVDHGAIQRASNEETVELLFDSACHAERDQFLGVSNNVLLGQLCPIGTGKTFKATQEQCSCNYR